MPKGRSGKGGGIRRSAALTSKLNSVENSIVLRNTEKLVVLDDKGNIILEKDGDASSVRITQKESALMNGQISTHNHPGEKIHTVFSESDLITAISTNQKELRAVNQLSRVSFVMNSNSILKKKGAEAVEFVKNYGALQSKMNSDLASIAKKIKAVNKKKGVLRRKVETTSMPSTEYRTLKSKYDAQLIKLAERYNTVIKAGFEGMKNYLKQNQLKYGYIYEERNRTS